MIPRWHEHNPDGMLRPGLARRSVGARARMAVFAAGLLQLVVAAAPATASNLSIGKRPPALALRGTEGGRLDGRPWSSAEIKGRITALFYVDPDEKDLNEATADAIKREKFPSAAFQSIAVINMAATWKPNWIIKAILRHKQKKFPRTVYVQDLHKKFVHAWGLADNAYVICAFDEDGRLLFEKAGKFTVQDTRTLLQILRRNVRRLLRNARDSRRDSRKPSRVLRRPARRGRVSHKDGDR